MNKNCLECKGKGYKVISYKICESCHGSGFKSQVDVKKHVKGISKGAMERFDLEEEHDVPCGVCKGKGEIEVTEKCEVCDGKGEINQCRKCGKEIESGDYCKDCEVKNKVYALHPACDINDLEIGSDYKGKVTRTEDWGIFYE